MLSHVYLFSGASAVGKTSVLKALVPLLMQGGQSPCICKIDCLRTKDADVFRRMGLPCVTGLSGDICPDHFLVSNLPELINWAGRIRRDSLIIETAGLCHRCSPATENMTAGCVLDCTASLKAPEQLGPMLTQADFVVLTKIDMVSQAELEIISWRIRQINRSAVIFHVDGLAGYGVDLLAWWLLNREACGDYEGDYLRHSMPGGVCSYCIGEQRVGSAYQQGIVRKIEIPGEAGAEPETDTDPDRQAVRGVAASAAAHDESVPLEESGTAANPAPGKGETPAGARALMNSPVSSVSEGLSLQRLTLLPGTDKSGQPEAFEEIRLERGELYTIVGNTGSGKSRLIKDVEQLACGDSVTNRRVLLNGEEVPLTQRQELSSNLVAHLGQNMRFVLDTTVRDFLLLHARCRGRDISPDTVTALANEITPEPVETDSSLNQLSGGQSRALMIADIAMICDSPVILIDEIENAGIDKTEVFRLLKRSDRLVLAVTHDPHTALMSRQRIVMNRGAVCAVRERSAEEAALYEQLDADYRRSRRYQELLRSGECLTR